MAVRAYIPPFFIVVQEYRSQGTAARNIVPCAWQLTSSIRPPGTYVVLTCGITRLAKESIINIQHLTIRLAQCDLMGLIREDD